MISPLDSQDPMDAIDQAYDEFCEIWLEGERPDIEAYCLKYAPHDETLRIRIEKFISICQCFNGRVMRGTETPPGARKEALKIEGQKLGDFNLLREVGRGGMGVVYEARQISLNRPVALKVLPSNLTLRPETVARFQREASTAAKLKHPGIVEIYSIDEDEGNHFFAMEFVEGAPLDKVIDGVRSQDPSPRDAGAMRTAIRKGMHRLKDHVKTEDENVEEGELHSFWNKTHIEAVCRIIANVAEALEFAHAAGVIHRDVKPSNILVREDGSIMLTDFGLAREEGLPSLTQTGELAGTPHYIAPEQASQRKRAVDHRVDIYSLGVTLYELLTLIRPFEGKTSHDVLGKIVSRDPASPRSRNVLIPKDLETICLTAMEKDPERRYQNAGQLKEDLVSFMEFGPIKARPAGLATRTYRLVRRNPVYSAFIALLFLTLVAGPLVFGIQQKLANIRIKAALEEKEKALELAGRERDAKVAALEAKEHALHRAEEESAVAKEVTNHLGEIFTMFIPEAAEWKENAADILLRNVVASIDSDLSEEPKIQSRLMQIMGRIYMTLGISDEAERLLKKSLDASFPIEGDMDPSILETMCYLGGLYIQQARFSEALPLYEEVMENMRTVYGEAHEYTTIHMDHLASLYVMLGQDEKAESMYLDTLNRCRSVLGEDHEATFHCMMHLGHFLVDLDRRDEAEPLLIEGLDECRKTLGDNHLYTINLMSSLGALYKNMGHLEEAEHLFRDALDKSSDLQGERGCSTIDYISGNINNLAQLCREQGRIEEVEKIYVEAFEKYRHVLGEDHPVTLSCMMYLGNLYLEQERKDEAEPLLIVCLEKCRRTLGKDHYYTLSNLHALGHLCEEASRFEEADAYFFEAVEGYRRVLGDVHPTTLNFMISLANRHIEAGRFDKAEALAREALKKTDADAPEYIGRKFLLKSILTRAGKVQPEFVEDAHAGPVLSRKDENRIHRDWVNPWILESAQKPIQLQTTVRYDQARRLLAEGEDAYDRIMDLVKVEPRLEEQAITLYLPSSMEEYNSIGDTIGDEKSSSYAVFYLDESPEGCPVSVTYSVGNDEGQERFTGGLVRHAVVEQYLNRINEKGEIPAWFVKGQAAKTERYFHPEYIQWSVQEALLPLGGFIELPRFFETFDFTAHEIHMAGMVCAFLESPSLNERVKSAYDRVLVSISNQEDITMKFRALEKALVENEKNIKAFMAKHR